MLTEEQKKIVDISYKNAISKYKISKELTEEEYININGKYLGQHKHLKFGDRFLSQIIYKKDNIRYMTYPQLNCFIKYNICDQALTYEYVEKDRTWMRNALYTTDPKYNFEASIYENISEVSEHIDWYDTIYIFGNWENNPNWKELRQAYERTFWYHKGIDFYRNSQINRLL